MKRFDPKKELKKKYKKNGFSIGNLNQFAIPILVVSCLLLAILGVSFSSMIAVKTSNKFYVKINVINGNISNYYKIVSEGMFADTFTSSYGYGVLTCDNSSLEYDSLTSLVSGYVRSNTTCTLVFEDNASKSLTVSLPTINDNTGVSSYYKADAKDNYIMVGDKLFRIVRENGDGSLRVMLNDNVLASDYDHIYNFIDSWFNSYFANKSYVVQSDFDISNYDEYETYNLINFEGYKLGYVGLLSVREADIILDGAKSSYFGTSTGMYLANKSSHGAWAYKEGKIVNVDSKTSLALKPVINIKVEITGGDGTINNPYTFSDK